MNIRLPRALLLLLCLVLPLNGLASLAAAATVCPMQSSGMGAHAVTDNSVQHDCCPEQGSLAEHAKQPCKNAQQCQTGSPLMLSVNNASAPTARSNPQHISRLEFLPVQRPGGVWRPPRS